jgi:H+-transporting ATPase
VVETFGLLFIAIHWLGLTQPELQSLVFLKLAVPAHLTLFVARTRRPFLSAPYPSPLLLAAVLGTQTLAALVVEFGWFVSAIPWAPVALVWGYALAWIFIEDAAKLLAYRRLGLETRRHSKFLDLVQQCLVGHAGGG